MEIIVILKQFQSEKKSFFNLSINNPQISLKIKENNQIIIRKNKLKKFKNFYLSEIGSKNIENILKKKTLLYPI